MQLSNVSSTIGKTLLYVILFFVNAYSQNTGTIQVMCEPNVNIFLDGIYKGTTDKQFGGIILQNIPSGTHKIKAIKEGFTPQEKSVTLEIGQVLLFKVQPFTPSINIKQEGDENQGQIKRKVGNILIQSIPIGCRISIPALSIIEQQKSKDKWTASNVPIGTYSASFSSPTITLSYNIEVNLNETIHLMINFIDKKITANKKPIQSLEKISDENMTSTLTDDELVIKNEFFKANHKNPVILHFWVSWMPVKGTFRTFKITEELKKKYPELKVVHINYSSKKDNNSKVIMYKSMKSFGMKKESFHFLSSNSLLEQLNIKSVPHFIGLNKNGKIIWRIDGLLKIDRLEELTKEIYN